MISFFSSQKLRKYLFYTYNEGDDNEYNTSNVLHSALKNVSSMNEVDENMENLYP